MEYIGIEWLVGEDLAYNVSLAYFVLQFIGVAIAVGGAAWLSIAGICEVLAMSYICWV